MKTTGKGEGPKVQLEDPTQMKEEPNSGPAPEPQEPASGSHTAKTLSGRSRTAGGDDAGGPATDDPFDPLNLRLGQDFRQELGLQRVHLSIPVRKPRRDDFVRVSPDENNRIETAILEISEEREPYLVDRKLRSELVAEFKAKVLFLATSRQGQPFLWPIGLPGPDGKHHEAHRVSLEAAKLAMKQWIRIYWDPGEHQYFVLQAENQSTEPVWPDLPFKKILRIAFKDRLIDSFDHPVLRRLRGEI